MERSQGFITSVFRVLIGSRCKTRRKQVTRIPPTLVTIGSHMPAALGDALTCKTVVEDVIQKEIVARQLATLEEETMEELSPNNDVGDSHVAEVQQIGKHVPICIDVEEHEHLTIPFNEKLNVKVFDTFTDLFSNVNVYSIQETYPKFSVYNKVITQYMEETNIKCGLILKFTNLEALEVSLWAKPFQVVGHNEDQQPPREQQLEPLKLQPQPPQAPQQFVQHDTQPSQQVTILTSKLSVTEQWAETDQMTGMATQWSCSIPVMSPIAGEWNGQHMQQVGQW